MEAMESEVAEIEKLEYYRFNCDYIWDNDIYHVRALGGFVKSWAVKKRDLVLGRESKKEFIGEWVTLKGGVYENCLVPLSILDKCEIQDFELLIEEELTRRTYEIG